MKVEGKGGISAEVVADSINYLGDRVTTYRLHYHRYIHSEFMTHRMFSKNASSSRAIPVKSMLEYIDNNPATPIHWGKNKPGMQADEEQQIPIIMNIIGEETHEVPPKQAWNFAKGCAIEYAEKFNNGGYHKQIVNRLTEPFQFMNVICTGTDFENFFYLRYHEDAQPEIKELAKCMKEAKEKSEPEVLHYGEWHTPFVSHVRDKTGRLIYLDSDKKIEIDVETAIKISASCCAQVSYRKNDTSIEKAIAIYDRLVGMSPKHSSPFEHVATPFSEDEYVVRKTAYRVLKNADIPDNMNQCLYCGNFKGWTQYRKTLQGENYI